MKVESSTKTETKELKNKETEKVDEECLSPCSDNFKDLLLTNNMPIPIEISNSSQISDINGFGLNSISSTKTQLSGSLKKADFNYDSFTMDKDDAIFFVDMVNNGQFALNIQGDTNAAVMKLDAAKEITTYKSANVSKTLTNLISDAYNTQKPVRIDFDNNVSVIMKIDKSGKLSADFIPGDKAVEQYLKNNISFLQQKFDDLDLPYNELTYRQSKQQNKKKDKGE